MTQTRREFIKKSGKAAVVPGATATTLLAGAAGSALAEEDPLSYKPESVSWTKDMEILKRFQPRLDFSLVEQDPDDGKPTAMFGSVHSSGDYDLAVAQYWTEYQFQKGWLPTGSDSHYGDHEPFLVFFHPDSLEPKRVVYSAYHWLAGKSPIFSVDDTDGNRHPLATVVSPWHQYTLKTGIAEDDLADAGELVELEYFSTDTYVEWWEEGWDEHINPHAVPDPYSMLTTPHWWQDTAAGFSTDAFIVSLAAKLPIDIAGSSISDLGKIELDFW